jgi:hypothetical protein
MEKSRNVRGTSTKGILFNVLLAKETLVGISQGTMEEPTQLRPCQGEEQIAHFIAAGEDQRQANQAR